MAVYVDSAFIPFPRGVRVLKMSHMMADTHQELQAMAHALGLSPRWIQYAGTYREHYDVCASKRARALELGAQLVSTEFLVGLRRKKREGRGL